MRTNQVNISLERFLDNEELGVNDLHIDVYADANNVYEALAAAYFETLQQLQNEGGIELPKFGRREHYPSRSLVYNNSFSEFLKKSDLEDEWRDFRESRLAIQDQFLKKMDLVAEFKAYQNEKMEKFLERKKNSNESINDNDE
ncbi:hypothetical protein [Enterococcus casseliflavus]|uniref:hypothetical protein n=1 Tax=Enterococcus casseliflavus TaxID=37734 RepID=UPI0025433D4B|nr:hypothetical protein [Enterococcus casseliflavus]MDK4450044.1 hypothetical protein [Enterococcus casseliflavus]